MNKVHTKGAKYGKCNICGIECNLTEDHVPPKGSLKLKNIKIKTLFQQLENIDSKIKTSQNGLKFRSLCSKCNNYLLGSKFDPSLKALSDEVVQIIHPANRIILPPIVEIKIQPQRLARSIIGHLLAAEIRDDMNGSLRKAPMVDAMRDYFLNETISLPRDLHLYAWTYRGKYQAIFRGLGITTLGSTIVVGDFLKFYPLAFWLTYQAPKDIMNYMKYRQISFDRCNIDTWSTLCIETREQDTLPVNWPEIPNDDQILLFRDEICIISVPT